jgi:hypothetical protein
MEELLLAVLRRLHSAQHTTLQQGLLLVFIRLFLINPDNIAAFLANKDLTNSGTTFFLHWALQDLILEASVA